MSTVLGRHCLLLRWASVSAAVGSTLMVGPSVWLVCWSVLKLSFLGLWPWLKSFVIFGLAFYMDVCSTHLKIFLAPFQISSQILMYFSGIFMWKTKKLKSEKPEFEFKSFLLEKKKSCCPHNKFSNLCFPLAWTGRLVSVVKFSSLLCVNKLEVWGLNSARHSWLCGPRNTGIWRELQYNNCYFVKSNYLFLDSFKLHQREKMLHFQKYSPNTEKAI